MPVNCHIPVVVRVLGEPSPEQLEALRRQLSRTVAARLAKAERTLAGRPRGHAGDRPPAREKYQPGRAGGVARVPSYDSDGAPVGLPVHPLPFEQRLLLEAATFLHISGNRDLVRLQQVVNWYADTTTYTAFTDALRKAGLDTFFEGRAGRLLRPRPDPSATLGADTIRMIYGPAPEEPEYWRWLSFEDRRAPITVGDRTHFIMRERTVIIENPGDQANDRVVVPDNSWELTAPALHAFLVEMTGGRLTPFEEHLAANWNTIRPTPLFDGPRIVGYHIESGQGSVHEHRLHDPNGTVVAFWLSEPGLVNEGLGLIDYLLMANAALKLGGAVLRAGARFAASGASNAFVRNTLFALRLSTRRLGRPLGAALEGADIGLDVPGIGAGRPVPALVERGPGIAAEAPRTAPSATAPRSVAPAPPDAVTAARPTTPATAAPAAARSGAPAARPIAVTAADQANIRGGTGQSAAPTGAQAGRDTARVVAVTTVDHTGVRRGTSQPTMDQELDESWQRTFDLTPSTATIAPGQGVVTTSPEEAAGFTRDQVRALRQILARRFSESDISVLQRLWDRVARPGDAAILNAANSRHLFDLHRNRFWRQVAADPVARKLFTDAGCQFSGGAPYLTLNGQRITITIDHIIERQTSPQLALTASNLRLAFSRENSVVLRLLHQLDPFQ